MRSHSMVSWAEEYLSYRRNLGYKLKIEGAQLMNFAMYADRVSCGGHLSNDLALEWARLPQKASPLYWARRLEVVRCFARYLAIFDSRTDVPPRGILGAAHRRTTPHIYSELEIQMLLKACTKLKPVNGLRPHTYFTLFGLLSCTGLRISEAIKLMDGDVDLDHGVLTINETKFHKSRLVPLHPSTNEALSQYVRLRSYHCPLRISPVFFVSERGKPLPYNTVRSTFLTLRRQLGWESANGRRCRIYDLRHTFATRRVTLWQQSNNTAMLPVLSTYLGHVKVSDTYWYLTGVTELFISAAEPFERYACPD